MKSNLLIAVLLSACAAQTQTLRIVPAQLDANVSIPKTIRFFCTQNYDRKACLTHAVALRLSLSPFPLDRLGTWSYVLVPADSWKPLVRSLGGDPVSPAFSIIEQRLTVIDSSLFSAPADRSEELLKLFGVMGTALLDLTVTHELGHAICQDTDERHADDYGRGLRAKKPMDCAKSLRQNGLRTAK